MGKISYTEEFQTLIVAFFKYRNRQWKIVQGTYIFVYFLVFFLSALTRENPMWGILLFGQFAVFWLIFRLYQMEQRYYTGFFLTELIEVDCLRRFAVKKKKLKQEWIDREIKKMLLDFGNNQ